MKNNFKIAVIGPPGSGKSTLAKEISLSLGIKHIELDNLAWGENWYRMTAEEMMGNFKVQAAEGGWVSDGLYQEVRDEVIDNADLIVFVNTKLFTCVLRVVKRCLQRIFTQESVCNGNKESLKTFLKPNGMFWYTFKKYKWYQDNLKQFPADKIITCTCKECVLESLQLRGKGI